MSWRYYETLTLPPDFSEPPVQGLADERDTVDFANSRPFIAWQDRTDRIFSFDFQTFTPEEWRVIREFFDRHGGRARSFFLPSWTQDLALITTAAAGATEITVEGNLLSGSLSSYRPDTVGRRIMLINHLGQLSTHWIESATAAGGNDILTLDRPIPNQAEAGRTLISICYLSRLVDDTISSEHISPFHAKTSLTFRQTSHRRYLDQQEIANWPDIATLKGCADILATDQDPIYRDPATSTALGPFILAAPQPENFQTEWIATLNKNTNQVVIAGPAGATTTALYNAPGVANQIALTFNGASREIIAWELDGKVTIARHGASAIERVTFPGYSPVAFNTYGIDSTVDAGTATVAIFYLKRQDSTIYCRIASENFLTEHRYCISPLAPIYLHAARRFEARLEIVGMDANHRLARWRSQSYVTPQEIQFAFAESLPIDGNYMPITVVAPIGDTTGATVLTPEIKYESVRVQSINNQAGPASGIVLGPINGAYQSVRIQGGVIDQESKGLVLPATGSYTFVRQQGFVADSTNATIEPVTGTYALP